MNPNGEKPQQRPPSCPYCGSAPCPLGMTVVDFGGGALAGIFTCGVCTKILSVAPLPALAPHPQQEQKRIVIPS